MQGRTTTPEGEKDSCEAMATTANSREGRRRKILERGSDRLAFITGQINGVPPSDSTSSSLPQSHLQSDQSLPDAFPPSHQRLTPQERGSTSHQESISEARTFLDSILPRKLTEMLAEASASHPRDTTTTQPSAATSSAQPPPVIYLPAPQAFISFDNLVSTIKPKQVKAAIDASEYARMFSALVIALIVVLSHLGVSSLGKIVSFRPVFLLILTDATIVVGRVLLSHLGDSSSASGTAMNGQDLVDQVGIAVDNAVEMVMMVKKIMGALLMDFSLYAVILISGLLFTQSIFP